MAKKFKWLGKVKMTSEKKKWNSRKLFTALVLFGIVTALLVLQMASFQEWAEFIKWVTVFYFGANTLEHFADAWKQQQANLATGSVSNTTSTIVDDSEVVYSEGETGPLEEIEPVVKKRTNRKKTQ